MSTDRRETRRDREIREAREAFCRARRAPELLERWVAWYHLRSILEGWERDPDGPMRTDAYRILGEAERYRRGGRLPETFHEANGRIRRRLRDGTLRSSGGL